MNNDLDRIIIRSKKVRYIIGEEPPWFIRFGTITIALLLTIIIMCIYIIYK